MDRAAECRKGMDLVLNDAAGPSSSNLGDVEFLPLGQSPRGSKVTISSARNDPVGVPLTLNWSSLFKSDSKRKLQFDMPIVQKGKKSVFISKSVHDQGFVVWNASLIG